VKRRLITQCRRDSARKWFLTILSADFRSIPYSTLFGKGSCLARYLPDGSLQHHNASGAVHMTSFPAVSRADSSFVDRSFLGSRGMACLVKAERRPLSNGRPS